MCRLLFPTRFPAKRNSTMRTLFLTAALLLAAGTAFAAPANKDTMFYCQFNNGKQVRIEQHGDKIRYRFGKNLARPELVFERPANQVYQVYLTPLLDNNQRGEVIEIYLRNGDVFYGAAATNIIRKTIYSLSARRSGTEPEMICKRRGAFINRDMALSLPDLLDTSY